MDFRKKFYEAKSRKSSGNSLKNKSDFKTKDGKTFKRKTLMERVLDKEMDEISDEINKTKKKGAAAIKKAKIAAEATKPISKKVKKEEFERRQVAKFQREKERKIINQEASNYYKAALQVTNYDFELAKRLLAIKKIDLIKNSIKSSSDILAIDKAIDDLDSDIAKKYSEFSNNSFRKRK